MTLTDCLGCRDDFYNDKNPLGVKRCWSFDEKKVLVTKYRIHYNTPMNRRSGYSQVSIPPCYTMGGFVHLDQIPDYAK